MMPSPHRRSVPAAILLVALAACTAPVTAPDPATTSTTVPVPPQVETVRAEPSDRPDDCRPDPFEHPPVDLDAVEYLVPFGLMSDSHVTPVDHQYFQNFVEPDRRIDVYSPADGRVVNIQQFGAPVTEDPEGIVGDYRLVIEHTCTMSSVLIHVDHLEPPIARVAPGPGETVSVDVEVSAGERIGWFTANVDYNLVDLEYTTGGLVDPSSYRREPWKPHVPDTFAYFTPEIADKMEALSLRGAEPRGGVFTWDVDGRLVGNWFEEGTGGYGGVDPDRYWGGHLAFAYDHLDPDTIVVSIGTFEGRSGQFAVTGNGPDPAEVSTETGPVVYELVDLDYMIGDERWDRVTFAEGIVAVPGTRVAGSALVEMIGERTIRFEAFSSVAGDDDPAFTDAALRFTR